MRLVRLDEHVATMLRGSAAHITAWELWHRGAAEVQVGLSILAKVTAHATRNG